MHIITLSSDEDGRSAFQGRMEARFAAAWNGSLKFRDGYFVLNGASLLSVVEQDVLAFAYKAGRHSLNKADQGGSSLHKADFFRATLSKARFHEPG